MSNSSKAHFRIEDLGDKCKVEVSGSGKDLINMLASLIEQDARVRQLIELAMFSVKLTNSEKQEQSEEEALNEMLRQLGISLN